MSHNLKSQSQKTQPFTKPGKGMLLGMAGGSYVVRKAFIKNGHVYGVTDAKIIKLR